MISWKHGKLLFGSVIALILLISCSEEKEQTVDEQYMESEEYVSFKEDTDEELNAERKNSGNIGEDLVAISDCAGAQDFSEPVTFSWDDIAGFSDQAEKCTLEKEGQTVTLLGKHKLENYQLHWYLLERQSAYRDAEIIVATFGKGELRSFKPIALYEKIPARTISTVISVRNNTGNLRIQSETNRDIKYPLDQENTIVTEYEIGTDGGITEL